MKHRRILIAEVRSALESAEDDLIHERWTQAGTPGHVHREDFLQRRIASLKKDIEHLKRNGVNWLLAAAHYLAEKPMTPDMPDSELVLEVYTVNWIVAFLRANFSVEDQGEPT